MNNVKFPGEQVMTRGLGHLAVFTALCAVPAVPVAAQGRLEPLADGVYAFIRQEPLGQAVNANSLIVIGEREVIVVDAQFTRAATLETIAAIRSVTARPVGAVINTHWHDDHLAGTQVYQDSFPGVRVVRHANTVADLVTLGRPNRAGNVQNGPAAADRYERLLNAGLGADSAPITAAERASITAALRIFRRYLAEAPEFREVSATDTVAERLDLGSGPNAVRVRWFGCGNTRGDLVAWLPERGIVATGDLVVAPVPFGFGSFPEQWPAALDSIIGLAPRIVVPGHGPVMRDLGYLRTVRDMLVAAGEQASAAMARGDSLSAALETITLSRYRDSVTGGEKFLGYLFDNFFLRPVVRRGYAGAACP
jgi:glyoxylase-like metal-dependent hydrolase (beta-lactamase superfamily II)